MNIKTTIILLLSMVLSIAMQWPTTRAELKKDIKVVRENDTLTYLYIIDGKQVLEKTRDISKIIDHSRVTGVIMITDSIGKKKYGEKGKNGVCIITTKK